VLTKATSFPLLSAAEIERLILYRFTSDKCGPSADFLDKLNSPVILGTSCFYGNWVEDVRAGQFIILGDFVGRCLVRRCTCFCDSVANV